MFPVIVLFSDPEHGLPLSVKVQAKLLSSHLTPIVPGLRLKEHEHAHWEMTFIIDGEMFSYCDGKTVHCTEESCNVFIMPPGVLHAREFGREKMNCNLTLTFLLDRDISDDAFSERCREMGYTFETTGFLRTLLEALRRECRVHQNNGVLPSMLQTFLLVFIREFFGIEAKKEDGEKNHLWRYGENSSRAEDIFYFLSNQIGKTDLMRRLCEKFHFSLRQLNRIFSAKYGVSLKEAQDNLRLKEACQLLMTTPLSNSDIARILGFANPAGFYTFFQRKTGMTPGDYRRKQQSTGEV